MGGGVNTTVDISASRLVHSWPDLLLSVLSSPPLRPGRTRRGVKRVRSRHPRAVLSLSVQLLVPLLPSPTPTIPLSALLLLLLTLASALLAVHGFGVAVTAGTWTNGRKGGVLQFFLLLPSLRHQSHLREARGSSPQSQIGPVVDSSQKPLGGIKMTNTLFTHIKNFMFT